MKTQLVTTQANAGGAWNASQSNMIVGSPAIYGLSIEPHLDLWSNPPSLVPGTVPGKMPVLLDGWDARGSLLIHDLLITDNRRLRFDQPLARASLKEFNPFDFPSTSGSVSTLVPQLYRAMVETAPGDQIGTPRKGQRTFQFGLIPNVGANAAALPQLPFAADLPSVGFFWGNHAGTAQPYFRVLEQYKFIQFLMTGNPQDVRIYIAPNDGTALQNPPAAVLAQTIQAADWPVFVVQNLLPDTWVWIQCTAGGAQVFVSVNCEL